VFLGFSWEPFNLPAAVHVFTLGFMAPVMIGSLFQMLPVVVGAVIENPLLRAEITHVLLTTGTPLLLVGFLSGQKTALMGGMLLIAGGIYFITGVMLYRLFKVESHTPTARGMKFAVSLFGLGVFSGVLMVLSLSGILNADYALLLRFHLHILLFGWIALLIASVAFQVIEMFFVTPAYPRFYADSFPAVLTVLIFAAALTDSYLIRGVLSALLISFALLTVLRLRNRRRKIPDPLVYLWYLGMGLLTAAMLVYPFAEVRYELLLLFLSLFGSFAHTIIMAILNTTLLWSVTLMLYLASFLLLFVNVFSLDLLQEIVSAKCLSSTEIRSAIVVSLRNSMTFLFRFSHLW